MKCDWVTRGENTSGYVLWCTQCGKLKDENSGEVETPEAFFVSCEDNEEE